MELKGKLILNENSYRNFDFFKQLYDLNVGDVFMVVGDYEAIMEHIKHFTPANLEFEVFPITPGTSLFTMYGPDHCVVVRKELRK